MKAFRSAVLISILLALITAPVHAGKPPVSAIMPAEARVHGHTLTELATAWNLWAWGTAAEDSPLLAVRCEQSPVDPRIWFLPVSLGGEWENECSVPPGTFLFMSPGALECSNIEPEPFFGADLAELQECVNDGFELLTYVEVTVDGQVTNDLSSHALTTNLLTLPPNNLLSLDSGISLTKGYFIVIRPLSPGTHTLRAYDEFETLDNFTAGITYTVIVE